MAVGVGVLVGTVVLVVMVLVAIAVGVTDASIFGAVHAHVVAPAEAPRADSLPALSTVETA